MSFSHQSICLKLNADISKFSKRVPCNITFIFNALSDVVDDFVKYSLALYVFTA